MNRPHHLLVGTYDEAGGRGLVPLTLSPDGVMSIAEPIAAAANASFGCWSPRHRLWYLLDEQQAGALGVYRNTAAGLRQLARVCTRGGLPCHIALDPGHTRLAIANYASGTVSLIALDANGMPAGPTIVRHLEGSGPVVDRQEASHAHCVRFLPDEDALLVADLGGDAVQRIALHGVSGPGQPEPVWRARPGSGPRHIVCHGGGDEMFLLVLCELASSLTLLRRMEREWTERATVSTLPPGWSGESLGGHLELSRDGGRVYVSNRGHDSIAVFALDRNAARLELLAHRPSPGEHPRHFLLLDGLMAVANERSGSVCAYRLDADGIPAPIGDVLQIPGACFIAQRPAGT
ncbi:6-phosphogluconolactonase [Nostoc sp. 3335mG]|nr:6-phosphogluconolactonase [Nostoc sp. 3335mG]